MDSLDCLDLWLMYLLGSVFLKQLSYTQNNLVYDIILWSQQPIRTKFLLFDKDGTLHWNDWCIINAKWLLDRKDFLTSIRVMNHWTVVPNKRSSVWTDVNRDLPGALLSTLNKLWLNFKQIMTSNSFCAFAGGICAAFW